MGTMFKSLLDPEIRSELAAMPWPIWALVMLPALLATHPTFAALAARGMA